MFSVLLFVVAVWLLWELWLPRENYDVQIRNCAGIADALWQWAYISHGGMSVGRTDARFRHETGKRDNWFSNLFSDGFHWFWVHPFTFHSSFITWLDVFNAMSDENTVCCLEFGDQAVILSYEQTNNKRTVNREIRTRHFESANWFNNKECSTWDFSYSSPNRGREATATHYRESTHC